MKKFTLFILISAITFAVSAQKKSKVDPKDLQIDSLKVANTTINLKLDSLSLELVKYMVVYNTIKEKILHYNFDPARTSFLIDSLKLSRDSATALLFKSQKPVPISDTLLNMSGLQQSAGDSTLIISEPLQSIPTASEIVKAQAISDLKKLKELLDAGIISEPEFIALKAKYLKYL